MLFYSVGAIPDRIIMSYLYVMGKGQQHGRRFIVLGHQYGRRFIVLGHQYGRRDAM